MWWRNGVCYEVFVRSFADSDGDGIGDLRGLISRLDYINDGNPRSTRSLGANCIWLMPISKSVSYHGYDVTDYYHVDPAYGTDDDFRSLMKEAHRRGIHVIVDFVINHSSSEHPWFQAALRDTASPYRDWYRWSKTKPPRPPNWGSDIWHRSPIRDEYYYGLFWHGMPDLNHRNPAVRAEMHKAAAHWITEMGADGFRLDAIPYLVEEDVAFIHTRGTHDVLREFAAELRRAAPNAFTIGEVWELPARVLAAYYPDQLDAYFAFGVANGTVEAARTGLAAPFLSAVSDAVRLLPAGRWSPFLTNHDQPRVMTVLGGDVARAKIAASAMLMLPGLPFLYYGEEIGMKGTKPDEQIRNPMQWSAEPGGGFTRGKPWEDPQPDWRTTTVAAQDTDQGSLLNHYRRLIHFRNAHPSLRSGDVRVLGSDNPTVAALLRVAPGESLLIVLNFGDSDLDQVSITPGPALGGAIRLEPLDGSGPGGCRAAASVRADNTFGISTVPAYGICAFKVSR